MKKIICLITSIAMLFSLSVNVVFASDDSNWILTETDGVAKIEGVQSIKGKATAFSAYGDENFEFSMKSSVDGAYAMEFSVLMYDFNAVRTFNVSGVDILKVEKDGKVISGANEILTAKNNEWYNVEVFVYPESGKYKIAVNENIVEGEEGFAVFDGIKLNYSETEEKGTVTIVSEPVIMTLPESVKTEAKTEITTFIQTQGGAPDYIRERIDDPTGADRGTITHLKLNGKKWMEGRQNATFTGLTELNVDWYFNDFEAEVNSLAARMNSTSGAWAEFLTFRHGDKKILLGNKNSTDIIGGDYSEGKWYNIKLIFDFDNSEYSAFVYDDNMHEIASGKMAMDESFESVAILSMYVGNSTLSGIARTSSLYVDNYYYKPLSETVLMQTVPFDGEKNVNNDTNIVIKFSNAIDQKSIESLNVTLNDESVLYDVKFNSPEEISIGFNEKFLEDREYTIAVSGLTDIFCKEIPVTISFKTADVVEYGELKLTVADNVSASIATEKNIQVYAVIYDENGKMIDCVMNDTPENGVITAVVTGEYDNAAVFAWDSDMNIITPAIKTKSEEYNISEGSEISVTKTDYNNDIVKISGTANKGAAIILKDIDGNIIASKEVNALSNGYFETQFKCDYYGEAILYVNTQNGEGIQEIKGITFYSAEQLVDIVDKFNKDEENGYLPQYKELIESYDEFFGFKAEEYNKVSKDDFDFLMSEHEYKEISDVIRAYNYALAVGLFNSAENAEEAKKLIDKYMVEYELDKTATYSFYENADKKVKDKIFENLAKRNDYKCMDDIKAEFEEQAILSAIESATVNSEIIPILEKNNDYLDIDFSEFEKLKNTSSVTGDMRGKTYDSVNEMKEDFYELTKNALKKQDSGNKGTSGGGSGSGSFGGGIKLPEKTVDLPVDNEVIEEVINKKVEFQDVKTVAWAEECIIYLSDRNIINGKSETHFMPLDNITRAEFVKIISLAFPGEKMNISEIPFKDVEEKSWYAEFVMDAFERGFIKGVSEDVFGVNDKITRQDIAVILYRIAEKENIPVKKIKSVLFYDDAEISDYAKVAVNTFAEGGIISGKGNNMFVPKGYATRAEAAKLIYSLMKLNEE